MHLPIAFLQVPSFPEMLLIAAIGLLLFGKRLPEVGRSLGKGIVEFKKGIKGIEDDVDLSVTNQQQQPPRQFTPPQQQYQQTYQAPPVSNVQPPPGAVPYKFDPYTGKPLDANSADANLADANKPKP